MTTHPILNGSILQLPAFSKWEEERWNQELDRMVAVGMDHVIVQWIVDVSNPKKKSDRNSSILADSQSVHETSNITGQLLKSSAARGMRVWLGLVWNSAWEQLGTLSSDDAWLTRQVDCSLFVLHGLKDLYQQYWPAIDGFYIPFELDNLRFNASQIEQQICTEFRRIADAIHLEGKQVMVAPFYNQNLVGALNALEYAIQWRRILMATYIDVLALQDGIGTRDPGSLQTHGSLERVHEWFGAFREMINTLPYKAALWSDLETYSQNVPATDPAPIQRVVEQLHREHGYVDHITSFSFNHFDSPGLNIDHDGQYKEYYRYANDK